MKFCARRPDTSYCQRMCLISGALLCVAQDEEHAYKLFCELVEQRLPQGFFVGNLPECQKRRGHWNCALRLIPVLLCQHATGRFGTGSSGTCVAQWCRGALARGAGSFGFGQNPATASPGCGQSIRNPLYMAQVQSFGRASTEFLVDFAQQWLSSIFANFRKTCVFLAPSRRFCSKQEFLKSLGSQSEYFAFQPFYSIFQAISSFCLCRYEFFSGQFESSWRTGPWGRSEGLRRCYIGIMEEKMEGYYLGFKVWGLGTRAEAELSMTSERRAAKAAWTTSRPWLSTWSII